MTNRPGFTWMRKKKKHLYVLYLSTYKHVFVKLGVFQEIHQSCRKLLIHISLGLFFALRSGCCLFKPIPFSILNFMISCVFYIHLMEWNESCVLTGKQPEKIKKIIRQPFFCTGVKIQKKKCNNIDICYYLWSGVWFEMLLLMLKLLSLLWVMVIIRDLIRGAISL